MLIPITNFEDFNKGTVLRVLFFLILKKFRRTFIFVGICKKYRKKQNSFTLQNYYYGSRELVEINFLFYSPYLTKAERLTSYNFKKTSKNFNFKLESFNDTRIYIDLERKFDPYDYIFGSKITFPERHRIRIKFRL